MQLWGFKTWKYKYKESEHKKIFKSWLVEESKRIGQSRQEDLSNEETREIEAEISVFLRKCIFRDNLLYKRRLMCWKLRI